MADNPTSGIEVEGMPADQNLMLEVLAARARLGTWEWTFPPAFEPIADGLQERGLVRAYIKTRDQELGPELLVSLTEAGIAACMSPSYKTPYDEMLAHYSAALDELWMAWAALAVAASGVERVTEYRSLPKGAASQLAVLGGQLAAAARPGGFHTAFPEVSQKTIERAITAVNGWHLLTRGIWERRGPGARSE